MAKVEMAFKGGCERHHNTRVTLVPNKLGDGYVVQMSPDMVQEADEGIVEPQSEVNHAPSHSCNRVQPERDSSSPQNQDLNQIESLTKQNDELEIENGLLYTKIQELNEEIHDSKKELKQPNATNIVKVATTKELRRVTQQVLVLIDSFSSGFT